MASLIRDKDGSFRLQFSFRGERPTIRLGRPNHRDAKGFKTSIESIVSSVSLGRPINGPDVDWLKDLDPTYYDRIAATGLIPARGEAEMVTLGKLLDAFMAGVDVKESTKTRMKQAKAALLGHFTEGRDVATITAADADAWRAVLKKEDYAGATISRTVLYARQMFRWAMKRGMVTRNPFADLKAGPQTNTARQVFIDRATIAKVIDAAPDAEWRLMIALSRFGGLRVPSEALALKWADVDWEHNRLTIRSAKTEHHEGKGERMIPLFPELREHLLTVYHDAPDGAVFVIGRYRATFNPNPELRRIIKRAGLVAWPRTWHNLRASRQTELAATFPLATVCAWIGNSKAIAAGHYLQVTDADWTRATSTDESGAKSGATPARKPAQRPAAPLRAPRPEVSETPCFADSARDSAETRDEAQTDSMGRPGLEPGTLRM